MYMREYMETKIKCTLCDSEDLDKSLGSYRCNNCKYTYAVYSKDKMNYIYDYIKMIRFGSNDKKFIKAYTYDILEYDPNNPLALYMKGCFLLEAGHAFQALNYFNKSYSSLKNNTDMEKTKPLKDYLETSIVFAIQNHMIHKFDLAGKKFSKNPSQANYDLIIDALGRVSNLLSYCKEYIHINIPDILFLYVYDKMVSIVLKYIRMRLDDIDKSIDKYMTKESKEKLLEDFNSLVYVVNVMNIYSYLPNSMREIEDTLTIVLSTLGKFEDKPEEYKDIFYNEFKDDISSYAFKLSTFSIQNIKKQTDKICGNRLELLMKNIYSSLMVYLNGDKLSSIAKFKSFDFDESMSVNIFNEVDSLDKAKHLYKSIIIFAVSSDIMKVIQIPAWMRQME